MQSSTHQHFEIMKQQRMSKDEVRCEHKESEGDPSNCGRRRGAHFEAVHASLVDRVRTSSAVIHAAGVPVALQYLGEKDLPRIIAKGQGDAAVQIRRFASEALIPTEFDAQLAQRLYEDVGLDMAVLRGSMSRWPSCCAGRREPLEWLHADLKKIR